MQLLSTMPHSLAAFFIAVIALMFRAKKAGAGQFENLLFIYIIVWKASYILFSFEEFVKAPLSILYFNGGVRGQLVAFIIVLALTLWKHTPYLKQITFEFFIFLSAFSVVFELLEGNYLIAVGWGVALVLLWIEQRFAVVIFSAMAVISLSWPILVMTGFVCIVLLVTKQIQFEKAWVGFAIILVLLNFIDLTSKPTSTVATNEIEVTLRNIQLEESSIDFASEKVTVINFFATWCPPCKAEMPHLQNFAEQHNENVQLIGINLSARDDGFEALEDFMETYEVTYPVLLDEDDQYGKMLNVSSIPTTIVFNSKGQELTRIVGPVDELTLNNLVKQYSEF